MTSPVTHEQIFELFKDQWVFDKLSGISPPTFLLPVEIAIRLMDRHGHDGLSHLPEHWMTAISFPIKQLSWARLLQRNRVDLAHTKCRIAEEAADLLKRGDTYSLNARLDRAKSLIHPPNNDPYGLNRGWNT